jgi:DNA gyrase subunit A
MRLRRLTGLEREKIEDELNQLAELIADLKDILSNIERVYSIIQEEMIEIKERYDNPRRTEIDDTAIDFIDDESLIPEESIVITLTNKGYIKRLPVDTYRTQNRGGKGVKGMNTNEEDFVEHLLSTSTHSFVLFFTNKGKVYRLKGYEIPGYSRTSKGLPIVNLIPIEKDEVVNAVIKVDSFEEDAYFAFATRHGLVKRTHLSEFESIRVNGKIAISLRDDDELISVRRTSGNEHIVVGASNGKLILFDEKDARPMGRNASGVRGILVSDEDFVVGMEVVHDFDNEKVLVVSENGYGKQTPLNDYRVQNRGGKGVITLNITDKNGQLISLKTVSADEDLMIITNQGIIIRLPINQVSQTGRATQGVRLIRLDNEQKVATVAKIGNTEDEDEILEVEETKED